MSQERRKLHKLAGMKHISMGGMILLTASLTLFLTLLSFETALWILTLECVLFMACEDSLKELTLPGPWSAVSPPSHFDTALD